MSAQIRLTEPFLGLGEGKVEPLPDWNKKPAERRVKLIDDWLLALRDLRKAAATEIDRETGLEPVQRELAR